MSLQRRIGELFVVLLFVFILNWMGIIPNYGIYFFLFVGSVILALYVIFRFGYFAIYHYKIRRWIFIIAILLILIRIFSLWDISLSIGPWLQTNYPGVYGGIIDRKLTSDKQLGEAIKPGVGERQNINLCVQIRAKWDLDMDKLVNGVKPFNEKTKEFNLLKYQARNQMARAECPSVDTLLAEQTTLFCRMIRVVREQEIENIWFKGALSLEERNREARLMTSDMNKVLESCGKPATRLELVETDVMEDTKRVCIHISESYGKKISQSGDELLSLEIGTEAWNKKEAERTHLISARKRKLAECFQQQESFAETEGSSRNSNWRFRDTLGSANLFSSPTMHTLFQTGQWMWHIVAWMFLLIFMFIAVNAIVNIKILDRVIAVLVIIFLAIGAIAGGQSIATLYNNIVLHNAKRDAMSAGTAVSPAPITISSPVIAGGASPMEPALASPNPTSSASSTPPCWIIRDTEAQSVDAIKERMKGGCNKVRVVFRVKKAYVSEKDICSTGTTDLTVISGTPYLFERGTWKEVKTGPMPLSISTSSNGYTFGANSKDMATNPVALEVSCS